MSAPLVPLSIAAPGFNGLNTQSSSVDLPIDWAIEAANCVIDKYGRIAARMGWSQSTTTPLVSGSSIETIFEYIKTDNSTQILNCVDNKIYLGTTTLTDLAAPGTITANNWKIVNFNNKAYFFQAGHVPLEYNGTTIGYATRGHIAWAATTVYAINTPRRPTTATPYYYVATIAGTSAGTEPIWPTTLGATVVDGTVTWTTYEIPKGDSAMGGLGRLWVTGVITDTSVVYYSDLLVGHNFTTGSSGVLDLKTVWTNGIDSTVAIEAYNGLLVIFAAKSIVLYQGASSPSSMSLTEHIKGLGCISKHTTQVTGNDLLFLSDRGIVSLGRVLQQGGSTIISDVSKNVRDLLVSFITGEPASNIRSTYNESLGFYLLTFPSTGYAFCFDLRSQLQDGTYKVTLWDSIAPRGLCTTRDRKTYIGKAGVVGEHTGYSDNGATYRLVYRSPWQSLDSQYQPNRKAQIKMPKSLEVAVIGGVSASLIVKIRYDYSLVDNVFSKTINTGIASQYGIAEYGISEYLSLGYIGTYKYQLTGSGKVFQFAIESDISGNPLSIQKIDVLTKLGRII